MTTPTRNSRTRRTQRSAPAPARRFVDDSLACLLAQASAVMSGSLHRVVREAGLSGAQWRVLAALADGGELSVTELAGLVTMQQPTLTKLLDRMEAEGLVRRARAADDRRRTLVRIAAAGRTRMRRLLPRAAEHEARLISQLPRGELDALKARLRTLIELGDPD
jgi:DNA-binding MarR family transcriptional regulator